MHLPFGQLLFIFLIYSSHLVFFLFFVFCFHFWLSMFTLFLILKAATNPRYDSQLWWQRVPNRCRYTRSSVCLFSTYGKNLKTPPTNSTPKFASGEAKQQWQGNLSELQQRVHLPITHAWHTRTCAHAYKYVIWHRREREKTWFCCMRTRKAQTSQTMKEGFAFQGVDRF